MYDLLFQIGIKLILNQKPYFKTIITATMEKINKCRISGESDLVDILSLGEQYLTGVFPSSKEEKVTKGPLDLVWAKESGLLQLKHSYDLGEMYGDNYGYRSGLNSSMVEHLTNKITSL